MVLAFVKQMWLILPCSPSSTLWSKTMPSGIMSPLHPHDKHGCSPPGWLSTGGAVIEKELPKLKSEIQTHL
jgi:hypothetical protein